MQCPVCENSRMREVEKDGILIDVCPICKGVWLDRGELDKLMSDVHEARDQYNEWQRRDDGRQGQPYGYDIGRGYDPHRSDGHSSDGYHGYGKPYGKHDGKHDGKHGYPRKKKKSVFDVFGDLFD
ncbi:zf-TFIIB domain-containing protein [Paenibacillus protaetiae]|uniref:Transcription factor zinc-finger domain-containing protein n=1 Tax=Paenibacillus protaetiae TaxID=2509456 RepID=A0A4P6EZC1_9BACL|nr:zf-TFIIB domain-containing protein [Paenibacillus protaetiae]QAY68492.1 hypothetical protein ET464_12660 [Paenibacillus protaetiae]